MSLMAHRSESKFKSRSLKDVKGHVYFYGSFFFIIGIENMIKNEVTMAYIDTTFHHYEFFLRI